MVKSLVVVLFGLLTVGCASSPDNDGKLDNQVRITNCKPKLEVGGVGYFPTTKVGYECDHQAIPDSEGLNINSDR